MYESLCMCVVYKCMLICVSMHDYVCVSRGARSRLLIGQMFWGLALVTSRAHLTQQTYKYVNITVIYTVA